MRHNFCSYPFESFFLYTNGDVKFCCASKNTLGNISTDKLVDILHNTDATEIRKSILNGEWHSNCSYCQEIEKTGATSQRNTISEFDIKDEHDFKLIHFDPRWSNTCNLSCVYCDSFFSSKWASIKGEKYSQDRHLAEESVYDFILNNKDSVKKVQLLGGEPLLQKQNTRLLDILPEIEVYVLTNLTVDLDTNSVAQTLLNSPKVSWGVSFETIGDRFEYIRHGADWNKFENNLATVYERTNRKLNAHPVFFLLSSLRLLEYCDYVFQSEYIDRVYWQGLITPAAIDIFSAKPEIKKLALTQLDRVIEKYEHSHTDNISDLYNFRSSLLDNNTQSNGTLSWIDRIENKYLMKDVTASKLWKELYD